MAETEIRLGEVRDTSVPSEYSDHPWVDGRYFYTVPRPLLDLVFAHVGIDRFNQDLVKMEFALSDVCGDHSAYVGFWDGKLQRFHLLRRNRLSPLEEDYIRSTNNRADADPEIGTLNDQLQRSGSNARGYLGWLLTNSRFLQEQTELFQRWRRPILDNGIPQPAPDVPRHGTLPDGWRRNSAAQQSCISAVREFCARWRLECIAGPFLPQPLQPHFPAALPRSAERHAEDGGTMIFLPDTAVVPSRNQVQQLVENAIRDREPPEHLVEWYDIASVDNTGKHSISRYSRLFELQHYCRVLYQRHAGAFHRKKIHLQRALAEFLQVNEDSIHKDLNWLSKMFGRNWERAVDPLVRSQTNDAQVPS